MGTRCSATGASGDRCKATAGPSGFCHRHDPQRKAEREAKARAAEAERLQLEPQRQSLTRILEVIAATCQAKGWTVKPSNIDTKTWRHATIAVARHIHGTFDEIRGVFDITVDDRLRLAMHNTSFHGHGLTQLRTAIMEDLTRARLICLVSKPNAAEKRLGPLDDVIHMLRRFPGVARQLEHRHSKRPTLMIKDEYDVQDLLHALLKSRYDDVRPEEYTPSYAGGASRIDFLLKKERILVEAKIATAKLKDKQIGEQLIIDIKRYQAHPDCESLVCFVYDPTHQIRNPAGLETDLSGKHGKLHVEVVIV